MKRELTKEEILQLADAQGQKLGFLLATCPLDEKTKKSILNIIEKSSLEQIDVITKFFEEGYLMAQNSDLNEWLKIKLQEIKSEFDVKQQELDDKTIKEIDRIEEYLEI